MQVGRSEAERLGGIPTRRVGTNRNAVVCIEQLPLGEAGGEGKYRRISASVLIKDGVKPS